MSQLPMNPLSPEQQQRIWTQMYFLMGKQVQSYHKHHHMGNNSSIPAELAQDLLESIEYTVSQVGGVFAHPNVEDALELGQKILDGKVSKAKTMLDLVNGTAPRWQSECRWETLQYLRHYLDRYDHLHLAHKAPEDLFYPILISPPEGIRGIDSCLFYLKILWIENQIMAGIPDDVLERFWDALPPDTLNQCEQLLINSVGKLLIGSDFDTLTLEAGEYPLLVMAMMKSAKSELVSAAKVLCERLALKDEYARMYVEAVIPLLSVWTGERVRLEGLSNLFV